MSEYANNIAHPGIVKKVENDRVFVMIMAQSACKSCHAKSICSVADMEEKIIEARKDPEKNYKEGERVNVVMKNSLGPKAVMIGYFIPFLIVVAALFILMAVTGKEGLSALISLALLIPYYIMISRKRESFKQTFMFTVE